MTERGPQGRFGAGDGPRDGDAAPVAPDPHEPANVARRFGAPYAANVPRTETVHVTAFAHSMAEYVNGALDAGFSLRKLGEWRDTGALADAPPRLVSLLFAR